MSAAVGALMLMAAPAAASDWTPVDERLERAVTAPAPGASCDAAESCGISLTVQDATGTSYQRAFGSWNLAKFAPVASASKWLTAAVVLTLVDDGLLDLDAPISRYLDAVPAAAAQITTRQLMSHTSGLTHQHPCLQDQTTTTLQACGAAILGTPLLAKPGTQFIYGGASIQVAGAIAERVSGKPWAALFRERVARAVGMVQTVYGSVTGANFNTQNPQLAGGASSTAPDLSRFLRMILDGGAVGGRVVLSAAAMRELERDNTLQTTRWECPTAPDCYWWDGEVGFALGSPDGTHKAYGIGVWLYGADAGPGERIITSPGAYGTLPWADLGRGYAALIFMNKTARGFPNAKVIYQDLRPLIEPRIAAPTPVACVDDVAPLVRIVAARFRRAGLAIDVRATDGGCRGRVRAVEVAVARRIPRACRWLVEGRRLGGVTSCGRPRFHRVTGTRRARLNVRGPLPSGRYLVVARASDAAGHRAQVTGRGRIP